MIILFLVLNIFQRTAPNTCFHKYLAEEFALLVHTQHQTNTQKRRKHHCKWRKDHNPNLNSLRATPMHTLILFHISLIRERKGRKKRSMIQRRLSLSILLIIRNLRMKQLFIQKQQEIMSFWKEIPIFSIKRIAAIGRNPDVWNYIAIVSQKENIVMAALVSIVTILDNKNKKDKLQYNQL